MKKVLILAAFLATSSTHVSALTPIETEQLENCLNEQHQISETIKIVDQYTTPDGWSDPDSPPTYPNSFYWHYSGPSWCRANAYINTDTMNAANQMKPFSTIETALLALKIAYENYSSFGGFLDNNLKICASCGPEIYKYCGNSYELTALVRFSYIPSKYLNASAHSYGLKNDGPPFTPSNHPYNNMCELMNTGTELNPIFSSHSLDPDCSGYQPELIMQCVTSPPVTAKAKGVQECPNKVTGNPISISTGNKFQQEAILSSPFPLTLSHNSLDQQWRHSYAYALEVSDSSASLIRPDGKGLGFTEASGVWTADDGDVFYTLTALDNGAGIIWKVTTQSGSEELYDAQGRILSITSLQGQSLNFTHTDITTEVGDEFGNILLLTLDANNQLSAVTLNGVTQTTLTYDSEERLISRTDAQNNTVQYHYEDTSFPNHLTGITGADGQRFATWAYDAEGRGILSEHAGQETAQLAFNADGSTTVTNSLGKQTTYHYEEIEGLKRPVQIEGHASENCVAANQAYTYTANGLVETQTDWSGNTIRFEYNDRGLITRKTVAEGTAQERVTEQTWHTSLPLLIQIQTASRITQYQYDAENRLISTEESPVLSP